MKKKKWFAAFAASAALALGLTACGTSDSGKSSSDDKKLIVGASNIPHAKILEQAKPLLKKKGVDLEIKVFQDYILPNKALDNKEIDANYFQHIPYMESQMKDQGYKFENAGGIHIEPIGIYSKKYKKLQDLPKGGTIIMRDAVADEGRILSIFQQNGLIKLKPGVKKTDATIKDIVENPKKLKFQPNIEAGLLPQVYKKNQGDAVVINANYALDAGLDPVHDPIAVESGKDNPYVNIITVRKGDKNKKDIKTLVEVLHSKKIQDYITKTYKGAVLPVDK
ncbi:D-methionine transport system substrate-binding protein [Bacillus sp. OV322]|uniref:MetQ/NlpA family ABC transporter substrate-binding protein n=1 Tax=Bacillus sp. OV322 TaxID=1882764 RepID=UPI0008E24379|nr:MetQ/NlpA family ABC transporter substrate-binding protein [Bacillus sp. OV322]SFC28372.1 D-methionine transport system substrate-binding protein [Bacillus sp. OV322]